MFKTETNIFCIMPPWPFAGPVVRVANYADALRMELLAMCENAKSAVPVPHKLWLVSTTIAKLGRHGF